MTDEAKNKRRYPRVTAEKALLVKKVGDETSESLAKTRTVGGGGCMFVHHEPFGTGARIELLISLPGKVIKTEGRVVWEVVTEPGRVEVGVEFLSISPKDRHSLERALAAQSRA